MMISGWALTRGGYRLSAGAQRLRLSEAYGEGTRGGGEGVAAYGDAG